MTTPASFFDLTATTIEGQSESLAKYRGQVVLVVNTASQCGYTPQYDGLEKLHAAYAGKGLAVLGFPSNDFGAQEPGSAAEIKTFCTTRFHVTFPLFDKVETKGPQQSPVYAYLTQHHAAPGWNFHKFLVGKDGQVVQAFPSKVAPDSAELRSAIDQALAK